MERGPALLRVAPVGFSFSQQLLILGLGIYLLLIPAWRLAWSQTRSSAAALFNRASYYPLTVLVVVLLSLVS